MSNNIYLELLEKIKNEFNLSFNDNKKIEKLNELLFNKKATYQEANELAVEVGEILKNIFGENITENILEDGFLTEEMANILIRPNMVKNYEIVSTYSTDVQQLLNRQSGVGLKAMNPPMNKSRIDGIVKKIAEKEFNDTKWLLEEPIINFTQSVVDDVIKHNTELQYKSGLRPKIKRKEFGKCCDWCREVVGEYEYPDVPDNVYKRHRYCRCTVEYKPGDGGAQDVWSKKWKDIDESDKIKERIYANKSIEFTPGSEEVADKLQIKSDEWFNNLTRVEKQAIGDYTDTFYTRINKYLRGADVNEYFDEYYTKDELLESIKNLDSALSKFELKENITFYRGISFEELEFLKKSNEMKNFVSLTTDKDTIAKFFIEDYGGGEIVKFNLKKGTKGAYVGTNSSNPGEREFILSRNSKYTIRNIKDQWEVTIIE